MSVCTVNTFCYRPQDYERYVWKETKRPCLGKVSSKRISKKNGRYIASKPIQKGEILDLDPIDDVVRDYGQIIQEQSSDFSTFYDKYTNLENVDNNVNVRMIACPDGPVYEARKDIPASSELIRYATPAYWVRIYTQQGVQEAIEKLDTEKHIAPSEYFSSFEDQDISEDVEDDITVEPVESSSFVDVWRKAKSSTTTMTLTLIFGGFVVLLLVGLVFYFFGNKIISIVTAVLGYAVVIYLQYLASNDAQ